MNLRDLPYTTDDIFPPGDFAFHMRFRRGEIGEFFRNSPKDAPVLAERNVWLDRKADECAGILPEGKSILEEVVSLAGSLDIPLATRSTPIETCIALGRAWAPDFLLLHADESSQPRFLGGCVCFPSSWSFEEKLGHPLDVIHQPVPTFNAQFATAVQQLLARMKPGVSWERINWGLSRSYELNQHPNRRIPRLDASVNLSDVWFRVEYQSLVALPQTNAVLFGIRLIIEPLAPLCEDPTFAAGLSRALRTMPDAVAGYKGILTARERLLLLLSTG